MRDEKPPTGARALLAAVLILLAGCANASTGAGGTVPPSSGGITSLTVTANPGEGAAPSTWTLTCDPPGGSHPQASAACAELVSAKGDPFAETPKGTACSMIYGGAQKAQVTGSFDGRPVDTKFSRTNGCEVARWGRVAALLVIKGGVAPPK
jgi:Subtilisin inhibitor-like